MGQWCHRGQSRAMGSFLLTSLISDRGGMLMYEDANRKLTAEQGMSRRRGCSCMDKSTKKLRKIMNASCVSVCRRESQSAPIPRQTPRADRRQAPLLSRTVANDVSNSPSHAPHPRRGRRKWKRVASRDKRRSDRAERANGGGVLNVCLHCLMAERQVMRGNELDLLEQIREMLFVISVATNLYHQAFMAVWRKIFPALVK